MSLEKALERLAEAIEKQNENMSVLIAAQGAPAPAEEPKKKSKAKAAKEEPVDEDDAEEEEKPKAKKKTKAKKAEKSEEENIHDKKYYKETVQPMTRKAAGALGKDVVLGILDEFGTGLETAKDLEEGQWKDYVARLEEELEADSDEDEDDLS